MKIALAGTAYRLPPTVETTASILERERARVDAALSAVGPSLRRRVVADLGIERVRTCGAMDPYDLMFDAAKDALAEAGVAGRAVDLIIDYSTLPGERGLYAALSHRLASDLGSETSLNLSMKLGGCAGLHLAVRQAMALIQTDDRLRVALLVATDSPPPGSRSLLPITIQGDAGSAVVLRRAQGTSAEPQILSTEVLTVGQLHRVITLQTGAGGCGLELRVDAEQAENALAPIYYLHFHRLVHKVLSDAGLSLPDIGHYIYSNLSGSDRDGFVRAFRIPPEKAPETAMADCGHTFGSDLVLNYTNLRRAGRITPGQWLLFASAGIGFTWGVTLVRA